MGTRPQRSKCCRVDLLDEVESVILLFLDACFQHFRPPLPPPKKKKKGRKVRVSLKFLSKTLFVHLAVGFLTETYNFKLKVSSSVFRPELNFKVVYSLVSGQHRQG